MGSPWQEAFKQGYICAVANIIRTHGETVIAKDVLAACAPDDWRRIDREDLKVLQKAGLVPKPAKPARRAPTVTRDA